MQINKKTSLATTLAGVSMLTTACSFTGIGDMPRDVPPPEVQEALNEFTAAKQELVNVGCTYRFRTGAKHTVNLDCGDWINSAGNSQTMSRIEASNSVMERVRKAAERLKETSAAPHNAKSEARLAYEKTSEIIASQASVFAALAVLPNPDDANAIYSVARTALEDAGVTVVAATESATGETELLLDVKSLNSFQSIDRALVKIEEYKVLARVTAENRRLDDTDPIKVEAQQILELIDESVIPAIEIQANYLENLYDSLNEANRLLEAQKISTRSEREEAEPLTNEGTWVLDGVLPTLD